MIRKLALITNRAFKMSHWILPAAWSCAMQMYSDYAFTVVGNASHLKGVPQDNGLHSIGARGDNINRSSHDLLDFADITARSLGELV